MPWNYWRYISEGQSIQLPVDRHFIWITDVWEPRVHRSLRCVCESFNRLFLPIMIFVTGVWDELRLVEAKFLQYIFSGKWRHLALRVVGKDAITRMLPTIPQRFTCRVYVDIRNLQTHRTASFVWRLLKIHALLPPAFGSLVAALRDIIAPHGGIGDNRRQRIPLPLNLVCCLRKN